MDRDRHRDAGHYDLYSASPPAPSRSEDGSKEGTFSEYLKGDRRPSRHHRTSYLRSISPISLPETSPAWPLYAEENFTTDRFPYSPLDQSRNEIRLLQLASHADDEKCRLLVISLDESPTYEAISYTWGDPSNLSHILLDEQVFTVTRNLELALRQLRTRSTSVLLWIDAICIDQKNDEERSQQVSKMGTIYAKATRVLVWLGKHFERSELAFELLGHIYKRLDNYHVIKYRITSGMNSQHWVALSNLLSRDYWRRVWVIQEINFARSIRVHCGSSEMDWDQMIAVQDTLRKRFGELLHILSTSQLSMRNVHQSIQFEGPQSLLIDRERDSSRVRVLELCDVLFMHRLKCATDPRDKIYGLVGLTTAYDDPEYIIDYSLSVRQVYVNTIDYIFRRSRQLDIICAKTRGSEPSDLPTWVPNFGSTSSQRPIPFKRAWKCAYCASGSRRSNAQVLDDAALRAEGISVSIIQAVSGASEMKDINDNYGMARVFYEWLAFLKKHLPTTPDLVEKYARLLLRDIIRPDDLDRRTPSEFLKSSLGAIASYIHSTFPSIPGDPELIELMENATPEDKSKTWNGWISQIVFDRRLFITMDGCLGLAEESIQEDDIVCVLFGCSIPVILRRKDCVYEFVSDACVVDYMYGKAVEEFEDGIRQSQIFEII